MDGVNQRRIGGSHGRRRIQHWAFNQIYRHGRWLYDPLARIVFGGEWDRWRRVALPFVNGSPVLDLGCGSGALLPLLSAEGRLVVGLDHSPSMLAAAGKHRVRQTALIRGDALELPFADHSFGSVVATFPAPYILDARTLDEIARILRAGGAFVVVMSGRIERWAARRLPVRIALALFYGRKRPARGTGGWTLAHPSLPGDWRDIPTRDGFALTWVAHRI